MARGEGASRNKTICTASWRQIRFFLPLPFDKHFFFFLFSFFLFSADYKTVASLARHPPPLCGNNTMEMQCIFHAGKSRTAGTKPDIGQSCNETRHCLPRKTKARSVAPSPGCLKFQNIPNISRKLRCSFEKLSRLLSFIPRILVIDEIAKFLPFFFSSFPLLLRNLRKFEYTQSNRL